MVSKGNFPMSTRRSLFPFTVAGFLPCRRAAEQGGGGVAAPGARKVNIRRRVSILARYSAKYETQVKAERLLQIR